MTMFMFGAFSGIFIYICLILAYIGLRTLKPFFPKTRVN